MPRATSTSARETTRRVVELGGRRRPRPGSSEDGCAVCRAYVAELGHVLRGRGTSGVSGEAPIAADPHGAVS